MLTVLGIWACVLGQIEGMKTFLGRLPPDEPMGADDQRALVYFLAPWQMICEQAGFLTTLVPLQGVLGPIEESRGKLPREIRGQMTARQALQRLEQFDEHLRHDSFHRLCYIVPEAKRSYMDGSFISAEVRTAFPRAVEDLINAGRCYALGQDRACVFHAIRAAEWGLKALARASGGATGKLDFKEWGKVIRNIEDNVKVVDTWANGLGKANALEFWRGALAEARALNNVWRTANFHVRPDVICEETDAKKSLERTAEFLNRLSARITESRKRPLSKRSFESN